MPSSAERPSSARAIGRYVLYDALASGGMATVHLARQLGAVGFSRTVAVKRLHEHHARDAGFVAMFIDEARLASRISHPNVVTTLDAVMTDGELFLVLEYVHGESLSRLRDAAPGPVPPRVAAAVIAQTLYGLHAAHEAVGEGGAPLGLVHRDVSPQNILVGADGVARVADFGIAKAASRLQTTGEGSLKGKIAYMAPEQFGRDPLDRRVDVFAASVVLWEMLTGRRLFDDPEPGVVIGRILRGDIVAPACFVPGLPAALDDVVVRGLAAHPDDRFATALAMATAVEAALVPAGAREVGEWVVACAGEGLEAKARRVRDIDLAAAAPSERAPKPSDEAPTGQVLSIADKGATSPGLIPWRSASGRALRPLGLGAIALLVVVPSAFALRSLTRPVVRADDVAAAPAHEGVSLAAPTSSAEPEAAGPATPVPPGAQDSPPTAASLTLDPARGRQGAHVPSRVASPPRRADCASPYTVGADGVRKWKAQCLR